MYDEWWFKRGVIGKGSEKSFVFDELGAKWGSF
jgi:hypothetical protein